MIILLNQAFRREMYIWHLTLPSWRKSCSFFCHTDVLLYELLDEFKFASDTLATSLIVANFVSTVHFLCINGLIIYSFWNLCCFPL